MKTNKLYIYGRHAAREALEFAPHAVNRAYLAKGFNDVVLNKLIDKAGIERATMRDGEARADLKKDAAHQGIILQLSLIDILIPFEKFLDALRPTASTSLVLLGGIQDPHNSGAIIRSAGALGASGVLLPTQGQASVTSTVVKVSAGMAFRIPLVSIPSVPMALQALKKRGFKVYGLMAGKRSIVEAAFAEPSVFVLGNEGLGLEKGVKALCDDMLSIPMHARAESLNVAASAAVALSAWSNRHPEALL